MVLRARSVSGQRELAGFLPPALKAQRPGTMGVKWRRAMNLRTGHLGKMVSRENTGSKQVLTNALLDHVLLCTRRLNVPAMGQLRQCQGRGAISRNTKQEAVQSIRLNEGFFYPLLFMICDFGCCFPEHTVMVLFRLTGAHRCLSSITLQIAEQWLRPPGPRPLLQLSDSASGRLFSVPAVSESSRNLVPVCASMHAPTSVSLVQVHTVHPQNEQKQAFVFTWKNGTPPQHRHWGPQSPLQHLGLLGWELSLLA